MNKLEEWVKTPAEWYEFWLPQSGYTGGLVGGAVGLLTVVILIVI